MRHLLIRLYLIAFVCPLFLISFTYAQPNSGFSLQRYLEPGEVFKYRVFYEVMRKNKDGQTELLGAEQGELNELVNIGVNGKGFEITYAYYPESLNVTNEKMEFESIPINDVEAKNSSIVDLDSNLKIKKIVSAGNVFAYLINAVNEGLGKQNIPIDVSAMITKAPTGYYKQTAAELKIPTAFQQWVSKVPGGFPLGKQGSTPSRDLSVTYTIKEFEVRYGVPILPIDWQVSSQKSTLGKLTGLDLYVKNLQKGSLNMSQKGGRPVFDGGIYEVPELLPGFQLTEELQKNKPRSIFALFKFLPNKNPSFEVRLTINRKPAAPVK